MLIWFGLIGATVSLGSLVDKASVRALAAVCRNLSTVKRLYDIKRSAASLNQMFLMVAKMDAGLEYTLDEEPWTTYGDLQVHYRKDWPYMVKVDGSVDKVQTIQAVHGPQRSAINMSSYSYAGAVVSKEIRERTISRMLEGKYTFGNHGPRMLGGNNTAVSELERDLAAFVGREACLTFSSGFLACKSTLQAVIRPGDVVFTDSRIHESLRDGLRAARARGAKHIYFGHNDLDQLRLLLEKHRASYNNAYVVVESVYSMDADMVDLRRLHKLTLTHGAKIILDEAHGLGIVGSTGRGLEELQRCQGAAFLIVGSFTKSFGSVGGFVAGSSKMIQFLQFFAVGNMFSAPMSPPSAIQAQETLRHILRRPQDLTLTKWNTLKLADSMRVLAKRHGLVVQHQAHSPIVALVFKDFSPKRTLKIASLMFEKGFYVAAVNPPAVPLRESRLRLTAPANVVDVDDIYRFSLALEEALQATAHILLPETYKSLMNWML